MAESIDSAILLFSTGKDSTVMLDLMMSYMPNQVTVVFLYFVKGLSFKDRLLRYYEKRFMITIHQHPHPDVAAMQRLNSLQPVKRTTNAHLEAYLRDQYDIPWLAYAYRKSESLERRGMLAHLDNGIDWKYKKLYPIGEWSEKGVIRHIKAKRLPLPEEYSFGFRDINSFKGEPLLWIYRNHREDYERIIEQYPMVEAEMLKMREYA